MKSQRRKIDVNKDVPYAEADGKQLNEDLYGFNIGYKITFSER